MSKKKINDSTLNNLYKSFNEDLQENKETSSYNELHNIICYAMSERKKQGMLEEEKLKTQAKQKELQSKDYLSSIALAVSITAMTVTLFLDINVGNQSILYLLSILLILAVIPIFYRAVGDYRKRCQRSAYYAFKLNCIEEVDKLSQK